MPVNFACIICYINYKSSDEMYTTTCGHVFHYHCMQEWQSRSTSCPQCRLPNPQSHRIYLNIEDASTEDDLKMVELKSQLEQSIINVSDLQHQLDQYKESLLDLQQINCKLEDEMKRCESTIEYLTVQNESQMQKIIMKTAEKDTIEERIKILEDKLKLVTIELAKEIRNSTDLAVEKIKLKCQLQEYDSEAKSNSSADEKTPKSKKKYSKRNNVLEKQINDYVNDQEKLPFKHNKTDYNSILNNSI